MQPPFLLPRPKRRCRPWLLAASCAVWSGLAAPAAEKSREPNDFLNLSLEELGAIKITSVSKKSELLNTVPAAVGVVTGEDIHRSGAQTLPEILRLAPGTNVAQVDASQWAVTVRGFNDMYAQKLLVLMDGRSIYTPLFSGTIWPAQDTLIEDIDRIEVVRGPGGTVWGANAVNGVISIVSKSARETQGTLINAGGGNEQTEFASIRHGMTLGAKSHLRVYAKHGAWNNTAQTGGGDTPDAWERRQAGFRFDGEPGSSDRLTLQGDVVLLAQNAANAFLTLPAFGVPPPATGYSYVVRSVDRQYGGNLLGRWSRQISPVSDLSVQAYVDRGQLNWPLLRERRTTFDVDLRHRFQAGGRHEIVWGGGYRESDSRLGDSLEITVSRRTRTDRIFNAFVQDEITLVPERLRWTIGSKLEHNSYTGVEAQPGAHLSWTPTSKDTLWGSISRAVRTPSQVERDARFNLAVLPPSALLPLPTLVSAIGVPEFKSETLLAYEFGYRTRLHRHLTIDTALFLNAYANLRGSAERLDLTRVPSYAQILSADTNDVHGHTYGGELAVTWQAADSWRWHGQVGAIQANLHQPPNPLTGETRVPGIATPEYQASLRSSLDLGRQLALDVSVRFADRITATGVSIPGVPTQGKGIPSYTTFDVRLGWRPEAGLELAVVGQNLAGIKSEFAPSLSANGIARIRPSYLGKVTWKF